MRGELEVGRNSLFLLGAFCCLVFKVSLYWGVYFRSEVCSGIALRMDGKFVVIDVLVVWLLRPLLVVNVVAW